MISGREVKSLSDRKWTSGFGDGASGKLLIIIV